MNVTRRTLFGVPALGLLGAGELGAAALKARSKTFILVHGAFHGGWCWRFVAEKLRAAGHRVYTPTLTGLGERKHLLNESVNLTTHIEDVVGVIRWEELDEVILVGHSYAGMVATGVADLMPDVIRSLVYVDAIIGADGRSIKDLAPEGPLPGEQSGQLSIPPPPASHFGVPKDYQAWVDRLCTPMPKAAFYERQRLTGAFNRVPRKLFIASGPRTMFEGVPDPQGTKVAELRKDPTWRTAIVQGGHDLMITSPGPLTDLLLDA